MSEQLFTSLTSIALAIVGLALVAVILSKNANTSGVLGAAGSALSQGIGAAVSPITGTSFNSVGTSYGGFTTNGF